MDPACLPRGCLHRLRVLFVPLPLKADLPLVQGQNCCLVDLRIFEMLFEPPFAGFPDVYEASPSRNALWEGLLEADMRLCLYAAAHTRHFHFWSFCTKTEYGSLVGAAAGPPSDLTNRPFFITATALPRTSTLLVCTQKKWPCFCSPTLPRKTTTSPSFTARPVICFGVASSAPFSRALQ